MTQENLKRFPRRMHVEGDPPIFVSINFAALSQSRECKYLLGTHRHTLTKLVFSLSAPQMFSEIIGAVKFIKRHFRDKIRTWCFA